MLGANVGGAYSTLKDAVEHMKQPIHYVKEPESEKVKAYKDSLISIVNFMIFLDVNIQLYLIYTNNK